MIRRVYKSTVTSVKVDFGRTGDKAIFDDPAKSGALTRPAGRRGGPLVQREVAPGRTGGTRLATAMASSAGVTGLGTCIWKPVRSASSRSCGLA